MKLQQIINWLKEWDSLLKLAKCSDDDKKEKEIQLISERWELVKGDTDILENSRTAEKTELFNWKWRKILYNRTDLLWKMGFDIAKEFLQEWRKRLRNWILFLRRMEFCNRNAIIILYWRFAGDYSSGKPILQLFVERFNQELVHNFSPAEISSDGVTVTGMLLDKWRNFVRRDDTELRRQILQIREEVLLFINFLKNSDKKLHEYENLKNLETRFLDSVYEADAIITRKYVLRLPCSISLDTVADSLVFIRVEIMKICKFSETRFLHPPSQSLACTVGTDVIVGFDDEAKALMEKLTRESKKLDVISVVGMAGIGKTTLARKVFYHPVIEQHFYIRGWTTVSHAYTVRGMVLSLLRSAFNVKDDNFQVKDDELVDKLCKRLKGQRYLIVMDDVWDIEAWYALQRVFPDDKEGSRILLTTRLKDVALDVNLHSRPHNLRSLTQNESWQLLKQKVFGEEQYPIEFEDIGKQILAKCRGLPLAITVIAGVLAKTEKMADKWRQVVTSIDPFSEDDPYEACMDTIALSYKNMPKHLRDCFLYLGTFPEDYEIPVRELTWLWVAEGLAEQTSEKGAEDVAEDYLMKLIHRNLVLAGQRTYDGGIKTCFVHDLLHDFCLRKAQEENFVFRIESPYSTISKACKGIRVSMHSHSFNCISQVHPSPHVHSFSCLNSGWLVLPRNDISSIYRSFKQLKVLNILSIQIPIFPDEVMLLVLLKFIALRAVNGDPPASISKLESLETLILLSRLDVTLPRSVWKIRKLRHLCIKTGENSVEDPLFDEVAHEEGYSQVLENLVTISQVSLSKSCLDVLQRTPRVKKLGLCGKSLFKTGFPCLEFLDCLESLKLTYTGSQHNFELNRQMVKLPRNLKKLTFSNTQLKWDVISTIGMLETLEYLNLEFDACVGGIWRPSYDAFPRLKVLKLCFLDFEFWVACDSHFPALERLVVYGCKRLEGIPLDFGNICTLQSIEVTWCSYRAEKSAIKIQEDQLESGNDGLKIVIRPSFEERKRLTLLDDGAILIRKVYGKAEHKYWDDLLYDEKIYVNESGSEELPYFDAECDDLWD